MRCIRTLVGGDRLRIAQRKSLMMLLLMSIVTPTLMDPHWRSELIAVA